MVELSFAQQSSAFLYSVLLGIGLAVIYGVIKFFRYSFAFGKTATIALDILFMLIWALSVFFFSLAFLSGYIRIYVFAGTFLGFVLYRLTIGRLLFTIYSPVIKLLRKIFCKIYTKIKKFTKSLLKFAQNILYNVFRKKENLKRKKKETRNTNGNKKKKGPNLSGFRKPEKRKGHASRGRKT